MAQPLQHLIRTYEDHLFFSGLDGPKLGERYQLRADDLPVISVKYIAQGKAGIQTAKFVEI